jgi:hypothetical protein
LQLEHLSKLVQVKQKGKQLEEQSVPNLPKGHAAYSGFKKSQGFSRLLQKFIVKKNWWENR